MTRINWALLSLQADYKPLIGISNYKYLRRISHSVFLWECIALVFIIPFNKQINVFDELSPWYSKYGHTKNIAMYHQDMQISWLDNDSQQLHKRTYFTDQPP